VFAASLATTVATDDALVGCNVELLSAPIPPPGGDGMGQERKDFLAHSIPSPPRRRNRSAQRLSSASLIFFPFFSFFFEPFRTKFGSSGIKTGLEIFN
jgi:hypothetical protein